MNEVNFNREVLSDDELIDIYKALVLPRLIENKMLIYLRQGKITKWFSGIGQEAISVGATLALNEDEYVLPMHRNLGVFTTRKIPLQKLFAQWQGKNLGFTQGRDRSFHFGSQEYKTIGMISHLGPQLSIADGIALSHKLKNEKSCTLVFSGEGATSQGEFHEALNIASVWNLPVIFLVENNGYALSTPWNEQFVCSDIANKAAGYGMNSRILDGNNVIEIYLELKKIADEVRLGAGPILIECKTFRMRGHEEASGTKYIPNKYFEQWAKRDPITNFKNFILQEKIVDENFLSEIENHFYKHIENQWNIAENEPKVKFDIQKETKEIYAPVNYFTSNTNNNSNNNLKKELRLLDAISEALKMSMRKHHNLIIMGQDIAEYGGVFKVTNGFVDEFGKSRIRNTPLCESAILNMTVGLSICGIKSVVEMQFGDFVTMGMTAIINNIAKLHYRWGQNVDTVIRMPCGGGVGAGPFHSQTNESWFTHTAGLKVVYPAFPNDAKGLLLSSIEDPNPVLYFEHKKLYRSISQQVYEDYRLIPLGKAKVLESGNDISLIAYGYAVHWCLEMQKFFSDISFDIIDLRSLEPLDKNTIHLSVKKTGKAIIVQEDVLPGSIGSDIASFIACDCFELLDAPVEVVSSLFTPVPFAKELENNYLGQSRLKDVIEKIINY